MAWVPYSEREEWNDVEPIEQDDGAADVVRIRYSKEFIGVMGYFRFVLQNNEMSERAFDVTDDAINLNAANYTAWHFRRLLVFALNRDLREELQYVHSMALENPKNYQIWHHRRVIVERLGDGSSELDFTAAAFDNDSKNYHAWSHRQWAVEHFGLWSGELEFVDQLLQEDVRNNSAWNQRYFVIDKTTEGGAQAAAGQEIEYAKGWIQKTPCNDSAWNYLKRFVLSDRSSWDNAQAFCEGVVQEEPACWQAMDLLVHLHKAVGGEEHFSAAAQLCTDLAETHDPIRRKYWEHVKGECRAC